MDKEVEFLIEGEYVSLIKRTRVKTILMEDFAKAMQSKGWDTGLLPYGCRMCGRTPTGTFTWYMVERPPLVTETRIRNDRAYTVSLGFTQFWLGFGADSSMPSIKRVTTTRTPVRKEGDMLYCLPWPNVYADGRICTGEVKTEGNTPAESCEDFVRSFFGTTCNNDLAVAWPAALGGAGAGLAGGLTEWERRTRINPLFGLTKELDYRPLMPLGRMVADTFREGINVSL